MTPKTKQFTFKVINEKKTQKNVIIKNIYFHQSEWVGHLSISAHFLLVTAVPWHNYKVLFSEGEAKLSSSLQIACTFPGP